MTTVLDKIEAEHYLKMMGEIGIDYVRWLKFYSTGFVNSNPAKYCDRSKEVENVISVVNCFKHKLDGLD